MNFKYIILYLSLVLLASCGEDRTHEYEEKTQHNIWIHEQMKDVYLWADALNSEEMDWKKYFAQPVDFFASVIKYGEKDNGSYILVDTLNYDPHERGNFNHINTYGFDFTLISDPTGKSTRSYARVKTVYEGSPAEKAGLKRNDFIESYDNNKLTKNNIDYLINGKSRDLVVRRITENPTTGDYEWDTTETIVLPTSKYVEDKAFPVNKVFNINNEKIGYLMCNRLTPNAPEQAAAIDYSAQLDEIMSQFRSANVNHLVLDLRMCNFGSIEMARRLASYIIPSQSLSKVFAQTKYSSKYASKNQIITFDTSLAGKTLELDYVVVIVGKYTQGAAEWAIRGLQYALGSDNVFTIGEVTAGQEFITEHSGDYEPYLHIYPAVAYVLDGNGECNELESGSITPNHLVDEYGNSKLYDYGDTNEALLKYAIKVIFSEEDEEE